MGRYKKEITAGILLILALTGVLENTGGMAAGKIIRANDAFLESSIESTVHLMIPIGVAKGAVDVIEGSSAVVEFGDIVQPLLDYLDIAWRILLVSLILSTAGKYILLGSAPVANACLIISICFYFVHLTIRRFYPRGTNVHECCRKLAAFYFLGALLFAVLLPLTVFITSHLSGAITEPLRGAVARSFDNIGAHFNLESITSQSGFLDKADAIKNKAAELIKFSGQSVAVVAASVAKLAVVKILEGIVFPFASLAFLIWMVRGALYPALGLNDSKPVSPE